MQQLCVQLLRPGAQLPRRATSGSAGYDLTACLEAPLLLPVGKIVTVPTGVAIALPGPQWAAFIFGRSGLGVRHGIVPANGVGVIDSDYRGELLVGLINHGTADFTIQPGDRIAQLVLLPVATPELLQMDSLDSTHRGVGGFGSTGLGAQEAPL